MATADEVSAAIANDAEAGLASASNASGTVSQHSLQDRIAAAEFVAGVASNKRGKRPFRILRMPRPAS